MLWLKTSVKWIGLATAVWVLFEMPAYAAEIGEPIKIDKIASSQGHALTNRRLLRKVTVVTLWATWCEDCKANLREFERKLGDLRKHKELRFALVSLDKNKDVARNFFRSEFGKNSWMLNHLYFDPQFSMAESLHAQSFPLTVIVDRQGKIGYIQNGFSPGSGSVNKLIKELASYIR